MNDPQYHRDVFTLAKEKGWDPSKLTTSQNRWIAIQLRSKTELIKDGVKAVTSLMATTLRLRVVSDEKAESNKQVCLSNKCGKFANLTDGSPVCHGCNCSSAFLESKWRDANATCPLVNPETKQRYWSNLNCPSILGAVVVPSGGDYNAQGSGRLE